MTILRRKSLRVDFQKVRDNMSNEIASLLRRQQELEAKNPVLKERMSDMIEALKGEPVSEATYIELHGIPERERSIRDHVAVRMFEMQEKFRGEIEALRREVQQSK